MNVPFGAVVASAAAAALLVGLTALAYSRWMQGDMASDMVASQIGATLSAVSTTYILARTLYGTEKRYRRHPNPLLFWKSAADCAFSLVLCSQAMNATNGHPRAAAAFSQAMLYASECWFVLMSYDLYACGTNPFQNTKHNTRLYHAAAWGLGAVAGVVSYRRGTTADTNEWILGVYYIYVVGCVFCAGAFLALENQSQPRGGIKEALKTRGTMLQASRTFTVAYACYQCGLVLLWTTIVCLARDSTEYHVAHNAFNFFVGARGLIDLVTWLVINLPATQDTRVSLESSHSSDFLDVALYPEFNVALRKEVLHFTTRGIVAASISGETLSPALHRRVQLHLHELGMDIRFDTYYPLQFRDVRRGYHLDDATYRESFLSTCHERVGAGGSSGAFMFYTADYLFLVKTITKQERRVLLKMLPDYIRYLKRNPGTHLTRYYGCHAIRMYGQRFFFVVMGNLIGQISMHQFFDIKGSWVNRNAKASRHGGIRLSHVSSQTTPPGAPVVCAYCNCTFPSGSRQPCDVSIHGTHRPHRILKDNDFQRKLRLAPAAVDELLYQLDKDSTFLRDQGIMDYSLLVSVHSTQYIVDADSIHLSPNHRHANNSTHAPPPPPSLHRNTSALCYPDTAVSSFSRSRISDTEDGEPSPDLDSFHQTCRYSVHEDASTPLASNRKSSVDFGTFDHHASELTSPWSGARLLEKPGYKASAVVGPDYYTLGIVDMLQTWTWQKQTERWWKVYVMRQDLKGLSAAPPPFYATRFQAKLREIVTHPTAEEATIVGIGFQ
ncbi:Aste57867_24455 [Aphanomyces stellatus]|uniref:Aste57867_24455 protein n=1 Tax=Aphanomyces stellatus TaxID=120398 RepID=A0A485LUT1_9STRA|nr:hypothetical protein As57867_024379 [Aphanomyces stellatus]VFU01095.1 Aste57867_24455 [Aphanomyces stellatus]